MSNKKQHYNIMKTNKPLTAVDWLLQQFDEEKTPRQWEEVYKQAKQLEKQQIINAMNRGFLSSTENWNGENWVSELSTLTEDIESEQYYNETYEQ